MRAGVNPEAQPQTRLILKHNCRSLSSSSCATAALLILQNNCSPLRLIARRAPGRNLAGFDAVTIVRFSQLSARLATFRAYSELKLAVVRSA